MPRVNRFEPPSRTLRRMLERNHVIAHVMEKGVKVEGDDRIGKTIVFAKNQAHAEFIEKRFDAAYPSTRAMSLGSSPTRPTTRRA